MSLLHTLKRLDLLKWNRAVQANNLFSRSNSLMIHHDRHVAYLVYWRRCQWSREWVNSLRKRDKRTICNRKLLCNRHRCKQPLVIFLNQKVSFTKRTVDMSVCVKNPQNSFIILAKFPFLISSPALIDADVCCCFFIRSLCHDILILSLISLQIEAVVNCEWNFWTLE